MWFVTYVIRSGLGQGGGLGACHQPLWDDCQLDCCFSTELHSWFLNQDLSPRLEPKGPGLGQLLCSLKYRQCFCFASYTSIPMAAFQVIKKSMYNHFLSRTDWEEHHQRQPRNLLFGISLKLCSTSNENQIYSSAQACRFLLVCSLYTLP